MGNVTGPGGPSNVNSANICAPNEDVATVKNGETTMSDVSKRLGIPEATLRAANPGLNPNKLQAGMDVCLPKKSADSAKPNQQPGGSTGGPKPKDDGPKIPKGRVGDYEVPLPKPTLSTEDGYDRGGTSSSRKVEQGRDDSVRGTDERDVDPKVVDQDHKKKIDQSAKEVDKQRQEGFKNTSEGQMIRDEEKARRDQMLKEMSRRLPGIRG
ncbi:MAG TPA: LysM domain-containing protein [Acidobacteriota bacterium]|nr:LysM domain-containing protein [Acidobacteriota bacterium]